MAENKRCPSCNTQILEGQIYCPICGKKQTEPSPLAVFFLTLLECVGFFAIFYAVHRLFAELAFTAAQIAASNYSGGEFAEKVMEYYYKSVDMAGVCACICIVIIYGAYHRFRGLKMRRSVRLKRIETGSVFSFIIMGLSLQFAIVGLYDLVNFLLPKAGEALQETLPQVTSTSSIPFFEYLNIAIATPICEEVLFRGMIHKRLRGILPLPGAVLLSSVIFGAAHMNLGQFFYTALLGVIFALSYEKTKSIIAPILIHMGFNGCALIFAGHPISMGEYVMILSASIGLLLITLAFSFFTRLDSVKKAD